ncbi:MAG: alpha/beta hydrolase-fold protein [Bacteroidota bacterium]
MQEQFTQFYSHNLGRNIDMLVFGDRGYPLILFPTTMGRYYENKDFKLVESARWFVEKGMVQIYCPDSINSDSWYNRGIHPAHKVQAHMAYDRFLSEELVPQLQMKTAAHKVAVAGPSFGGYHAANFAFRHPSQVSHLFSMSGAFDIKTFLDGYYDDNVYFNNPVDFMQNANDPALWGMKIVLGTSEWDICLEPNRRMSDILNSKGINHWLDVRGWQKHDWPLWREMFPHYLSQM